MEVSNFQFQGNTSQSFGGGVYNAGTFNLHQGSLSGNTVTSDTGRGGGLYNSGNVSLDENVTVNDNSANAGAGLLLTDDSVTNLNIVTIENNILTGSAPQGKGIYQSTDADLAQEAVDNPDGLYQP